MIYIVTGYMRTGTSMMMASLINGGMEAVWSEQRNSLANSHSDSYYHPNKQGLYEIPLDEYSNFLFPKQYQNKLIKIMTWGMSNIAVDEYRIILMKRNKEEIRQSYEGFFGRPLKDKSFDLYEERMVELEKTLLNRRDIKSLNIFNYRDIIENPSKLAELIDSGWQFDLDKAISVIDENQYRFRLEKLTIGI